MASVGILVLWKTLNDFALPCVLDASKQNTSDANMGSLCIFLSCTVCGFCLLEDMREALLS